MANLLIINITVPYPLHHNGNTVRVLPLTQELGKDHRCYLATFGEKDERYNELAAQGIYDDILLLPAIPRKLPWWRHVFWRTGNLIKRLHPDYYRHCVSRIGEFAQHNRIDSVLVHTMIASEFAESLPIANKVVDAIDSRYLYLERQQRNASKKGIMQRVKAKRELARARYQESRLLQHFSLATTISARDSATLRQLTRADDKRIFDIPNGVSPELETWADTGVAPERAIAFWGALDFPPNKVAVTYFYEQIFLPYLSEQNLTWYIIGRNAGPDIQAYALRHPNIVVTGFVPDLFALVRNIPVLINPMLIGGGLKNKVLEAFAMQRAVVSNALGMEAIHATPGKHYLAAETPRDFAEQTLQLLDDPALARRIGQAARQLVLEQYTWPAIARKMNDLLAMHSQE